MANLGDDAHDLGDERDLRITLTVGGVPTDPSALTFNLLEADGTITTYVKDVDEELEAVETGTWRVLWIVRKAGRHQAWFRATGLVTQVEPLTFYGIRAPDGAIAL